MYEYLLHVGAQKSAQTFLSEVRYVFYDCSMLDVAHVCNLVEVPVGAVY